MEKNHMKLEQRLQQAYPNGGTPPYVVKLLRGDYQSQTENEAAYRELDTRCDRLYQQVQSATEQVRALSKHRDQQQTEARELSRKLAQPLATLTGPQVGALLADAAGYDRLLAALNDAIDQASTAEQSARAQSNNASVLVDLGRVRHQKTLPSADLLAALADEGDLFTPEIYAQVEQARQQRVDEAERQARANEAASARQARAVAEQQALLDAIPAMTDWQRLIQLAFGATPPVGVSDLFTNGAYQEAGRLRLQEARDRSKGLDVTVRAATLRLCELVQQPSQATKATVASIWATAPGQAGEWK
jgi:hypothetical protein